MSLCRHLRQLARAACVALAAAVAGAPVGAVEIPSGSKNFTAPRSAPNYFSNESGPFQGGANARAAQPGPASPGPAPGFASPVPHRGIAVASRRHGGRHAAHAAKARGRYRLARRGTIGHGHVVQAHAARVGKPSVRRIAHAHHGPAPTKAVLATARHRPAPSKGKRVARSHG